MNTHRLKHLLLQVFLKGDTICFDELYNYEKGYMETYIKGIYGNVKDQKTYSLYDVIQESWCNAWIYMNKDHINIDYESDFHFFLAGIAMDTIIQINNK